MLSTAFKNLAIIGAISLAQIFGFSAYGFFHEEDFVRKARDPRSSEVRARSDALRNFTEGTIFATSYLGHGGVCITPVVSTSELEEMYPDVEVMHSHHGLCWWLRQWRGSSFVFEHNERYATTYNLAMLQQVHAAYGRRSDAKSQ